MKSAIALSLLPAAVTACYYSGQTANCNRFPNDECAGKFDFGILLKLQYTGCTADGFDKFCTSCNANECANACDKDSVTFTACDCTLDGVKYVTETPCVGGDALKSCGALAQCPTPGSRDKGTIKYLGCGDYGVSSMNVGCFGSTTTACRVTDASVDPARAYDDCFGATPSSTPSAFRVPMDTLLSGDYVLSAAPEAVHARAAFVDRVLVTQHRDTAAQDAHSLLTFAHASGQVTMTADHVIFADGAFKPAHQVEVGAALSSGEIVDSKTIVTGTIVNPVTVSGTVLAAGPTGLPVVASTASEWMAPAILSEWTNASASFLLARLFPLQFQAYYDDWLDARLTEAAVTFDRAAHATPVPVQVGAFVAADVAVAAGFVAYVMVANKAITVAVAVATMGSRHL